MKSIFSALWLFALSAAIAGCRTQSAAPGGADNDGSPVVVEINGYPERHAAFERFFKARLSDFTAQAQMNQADNDQLRSRLFDEFVQRQMVVREALKKNIVPTEDEIRKAIEDQHKQTSGEGADPNQAGLEGAERRKEMVNDLLTLKFYQTELLKDVAIAPQEVESYFKEHQAEYRQQGGGFYVREIRVAEEAEAKKLYDQAVAKPLDFAVLAKQHSKSPTAINGGLMLYSAQQLPPVLEQAITPLKAGEISKVIKSNHGFHIFKLEKRAEPRTFEQVKEEIQEKLLRAKNQALIDQFNRRAMNEAQIKIYRDRLGFNYTGNLQTDA
jgi:parvulin-like peptidyl-prolyl isomerase